MVVEVVLREICKRSHVELHAAHAILRERVRGNFHHGGFAAGAAGFVEPPADGSAVEVRVKPDSERLQLLQPFPAWNGKDYERLPESSEALVYLAMIHLMVRRLAPAS